MCGVTGRSGAGGCEIAEGVRVQRGATDVFCHGCFLAMDEHGFSRMKRGGWMGSREAAKGQAEGCRELWFVEVVFYFLQLRKC